MPLLLLTNLLYHVLSLQHIRQRNVHIVADAHRHIAMKLSKSCIQHDKHLCHELNAIVDVNQSDVHCIEVTHSMAYMPASPSLCAWLPCMLYV